MSHRKHGSAKRRIKIKRLKQRETARRRAIFAVLGFLGMSTLLGFAFLLGGHGATEKKEPVQARESSHKGAGKPSGRKLRIADVQKMIVAEEYPEENEKTGFGLEDLIRKTRRSRKEANETAISPAGHGKKPELVLIIDDISQARQLKELRSLPLRITPSIFPPSRISGRSHLLARGLKHFMIHLPMESATAKMNLFTKTLFVHDSPETVEKRVEEIRRLFPEGRYVNNHTGSVFTSDYRAMHRLYGDLKKNGFIFLDSRTSGKSTVRRVARSYGDPYLSRDVFLDNVLDRGKILGQLRRAVSIARKRGYAIAIGHPHHATFEALRHAGAILSQVKTVYFDDFYREHYGR